jgi:hypothetical protein
MNVKTLPSFSGADGYAFHAVIDLQMKGGRAVMARPVSPYDDEIQ